MLIIYLYQWIYKTNKIKKLKKKYSTASSSKGRYLSISSACRKYRSENGSKYFKKPQSGEKLSNETEKDNRLQGTS